MDAVVIGAGGLTSAANDTVRCLVSESPGSGVSVSIGVAESGATFETNVKKGSGN